MAQKLVNLVKPVILTPPKALVQPKSFLPPLPTRVFPSGATSLGMDEDLSALVLPTGEVGVAPGGMDQTSWMFYGLKRIGKSSLASKFPGSIVFRFEIASQRNKAQAFDCPTWAHFLKGIDLMKAERTLMGDQWHRRIAVIDTPFEGYARCKEYVCRKNGVTYTSDAKDRGGIWDKISAEFRRAHMELQALGLGLAVVCHDEIKECQTMSGQTFDMIVPKLSKQADDLYRAIIQNVILYHYRDRQRWLTLRGSDYVFAGVIGDEDDPVFMTPEGKKVYAVYAGETATEAFTNLQAAFNCEQTETYSDTTQQFEAAAMAASIREKILNNQKKAAKKREQ
jgi:hypothetical protein